MRIKAESPDSFIPGTLKEIQIVYLSEARTGERPIQIDTSKNLSEGKIMKNFFSIDTSKNLSKGKIMKKFLRV